jgi:hypothetical protein
MKKINIIFLSLILLFSFAAISHALPMQSLTSRTDTVDNSVSSDILDLSKFGYTGADYSGFYIGTVSGNDSTTFLEELIQYYFNDPLYTISDYTKVDSPTGGTTGNLTYSIDPATQSDTPKWIGGDWSITAPNAVEFYSVKATNSFALYYLNPMQASGDWWTGHLLAGNQQQVDSISHFVAVSSAQPVPEPATMLLLGTGLLGIAAASRKKLLKKS